MLALYVFLLSPAPTNASQAVELSNAAYSRLGQALYLFIEKFAEAGGAIGRGNFTAKAGKPRYSANFRKMSIQIIGIQKLPVEAARHRAVRFFFTETPLPLRKECTGFFRVYPPENLESISARSSISLPFRLDLEINLQECVFIAAKSGIGFAIDESKILESDKLLIPLKNISNAQFKGLLEKFFPSICSFVADRSSSRFLNSALSIGAENKQQTLKAIGIDEVIAFTTFASLQAAKYVASQHVARIAAGSVGTVIATIVVPVPVVGEVAVGAMLISLAIHNAPALLEWSIKEFQKGMFRDRLGKITMHLMGKYPPGSYQVTWFIDQVKKEALKDEFVTLHKTLFFLRLQPRNVRLPWKKALRPLVEPLTKQSLKNQSFKAEKYLSIVNYLLSES